MISNKLYIVIPVFSGLAQLHRCLDALDQSTNKHFSVVLVDHGETEEITLWARSRFPSVTCLRGSSSLWWSGATNLGIRYALEQDCDLIMLLNHDCFVRPDTIDILLKSRVANSDSIVAPVQHNIRTGRHILRATSCFLLGFSTMVFPEWWPPIGKKQGLVLTNLLIGGRGAVISANAFSRVGLLDEDSFPHYGADHDFYFRLRKQGYRLLVNPNSIIDVDDTKTSAAESTNIRSLESIRTILFGRSSHRNLRDQYKLFSKYYPIPLLAFVGVALNLTRFFLVTVIAGLSRLIFQK